MNEVSRRRTDAIDIPIKTRRAARTIQQEEKNL